MFAADRLTSPLQSLLSSDSIKKPEHGRKFYLADVIGVPKKSDFTVPSSIETIFRGLLERRRP